MINDSSLKGSSFEDRKIIQEAKKAEATKQDLTQEPEEGWDVEPDCPP